jgi:GNAT superfamily N-acetyltransferase/predicted nucleic acid-binding protein
MKIEIIDIKHPLFPDVMILGKQNAKTLGHFPEGAFRDHAQRKTIYGAVKDGKLLGYVLFRITKSKQIISITHLCIRLDQRGEGIGKFLLEQVKDKYAKLYKGMNLSCRKDYTVPSKFWEDFGFKAFDTVKSRSKTEHYLVKWRYDFGNSDLFSSHADISPKVNALLDSNIIMKLSDDPCLENAEAIALTADWLTDETDFYFAPEVFNEINRDVNTARAKETRKYVQRLNEARFIPEQRDRIISELITIIKGDTNNARSDRNQLSECIAAGLEYFITLDDDLLENSDTIYDTYAVRIARPADFILSIDHNIKGRDYNSYRVAGASHVYVNIQQNELDNLLQDHWLDTEGKEKRHELRQKLTHIIADIKHSEFKLVKDSTHNCVGYFGVNFKGDELNIMVVRTMKGKISSILFQQLIKDIILLGIQRESSVIKLHETFLSEDRLLILSSFGFERKDSYWYKIILCGQHLTKDALSSDQVLNRLWDCPAMMKRLEELQGDDLQKFKLQLEKKLWPVRFTDIDVPTYIIPIKPHWAGQLFDHYISGNNLFGAKPEISWSKENIYYRSVKPVSEIAPGRILWYVSADVNKGSEREKCIVATSYLEDVQIAPAKVLFQKYKNYGTYEWRNIYNLAGNHALREIKAIKFIDTEVFKKAISLRQIHGVMKRFGRPVNTFASPVEVSTEIFNELYRLGKQ